jgi:branched-chain amino acid transport system substrate-binding protein
MKRINGFIVLLACFACGTASAEISDSVVRVGVLNDISGLFQDTNGMGSVEAARMAAEDFHGGGKNIKVEIVYADHQKKADVGAAIARKWLDVEGVDAIVDVPNSAGGLTINSLLRDTRMTFLASSTASSDLTGKACSPNTIQWVIGSRADQEDMIRAITANGLKPVIDRCFPLEEIVAAFRHYESQKHFGKVCLEF